MWISKIRQNIAPFWDKFDTGFFAVLAVLNLIGYLSFVETISGPGLLNASFDFMKNSGLLALLTSSTAIIALYRLRHNPDKSRPSVREDFNNLDEDGISDFGLRNFGPGPALYLQAVATIEYEELEDEVARFQVHDPPTHLREGEFASLLHDTERDWLSEVAEKYNTGQSHDKDGEHQNSPMVNIYFTYVSSSGARTPTDVNSDREDSNLLDDIKEDDSGTRHIELSKVIDVC